MLQIKSRELSVGVTTALLRGKPDTPVGAVQRTRGGYRASRGGRHSPTTSANPNRTQDKCVLGAADGISETTRLQSSARALINRRAPKSYRSARASIFSACACHTARSSTCAPVLHRY